MKIAKKLLICGLSLALISSVGVQGVSAHHVHAHRHYRISRVMKRHHKKFIHRKYRHRTMKLNSAKQGHYLSFNQLMKAMNYDGSHNSTKYSKVINSSVRHNLKKYTTPQVYQILDNRTDHPFNNPNFNHKLCELLFNQAYTNSDYLHIEDNQGNAFNTAVRKNLVKNINNSRVAHGLNPLKVTNIMQNGADYRDPYAQYEYEHLSEANNYPHNTSNPTEDWVHGVDTNNAIDNYLERYGFSGLQYGSNVGTWSKNNDDRNQDGTPTKYDATTPQGVASNIDDDVMNHDMAQGNNNGHRLIELSPKWKYIGVGITYDPNVHYGTFNEQFSSDMEQ